MRLPLRTLFCAAAVALLPRLAVSQGLNAAVTARPAEVVALPTSNTMGFDAISDTAWSRSLRQGTVNRNGRRLLFTSTRSGSADIWSVNVTP